MMEPVENELLVRKFMIARYGFGRQSNQAVEELAELAIELSDGAATCNKLIKTIEKWNRKGSLENLAVLDDALLQRIIQETVDVDLMLGQVRLIVECLANVSKEDIDAEYKRVRQYKLERLVEQCHIPLSPDTDTTPVENGRNNVPPGDCCSKPAWPEPANLAVKEMAGCQDSMDTAASDLRVLRGADNNSPS